MIIEISIGNFIVMTRSTVQRETIMEVLSHSHYALSPEELLTECQKHLPAMGIATIHRELKRLRDEHTLEEVQVPHDVLRFCITKKHHHHHFKCTSCEKVYDIDCHGLDVKLPSGFKKTAHELNIFGICSNC